MLTFKSDPDVWKDKSKAEIWAEIKDTPLGAFIKELKRYGMEIERPRKYLTKTNNACVIQRIIQKQNMDKAVIDRDTPDLFREVL